MTVTYEMIRRCVHEAIEEFLAGNGTQRRITPDTVEQCREIAMKNLQSFIAREPMLFEHAAIDACLALQMYNGGPAAWRARVGK